MKDIKQEVEKRKIEIPYEEMKEMALSKPIKGSDDGGFVRYSPYCNKICSKLIKIQSLIAEVRPDFPIEKYDEHVKAFTVNGSLEFLEQVSNQTDKPLLYKGAIVDEYQIAEARFHGASAIQLMMDKLDYKDYERLFIAAAELQMHCQIEIKNLEDIKKAFKLKPLIVGINDIGIEKRISLAPAVRSFSERYNSPTIVTEVKDDTAYGLLKDNCELDALILTEDINVE